MVVFSKLKGSWLATAIGFTVLSCFVGMIFTALAMTRVVDLLIALPLSFILAVLLGLAIIKLLLRGSFVDLEAYRGLMLLEVDGLGNARFVPGIVKEGKVYHPNNPDSPICEFDRDRYALSLVSNPHPVEERVSDFIFALAGRPLIIIDAVTKIPLSKKAISRAESIVLSFVNTVAKMSSLMVEKASALEPVIAERMTSQSRFRALLNQYGNWIFLIIFGTLLGIGILYYIINMSPGAVSPPKMPIVSPR